MPGSVPNMACAPGSAAILLEHFERQAEMGARDIKSKFVERAQIHAQTLDDMIEALQRISILYRAIGHRLLPVIARPASHNDGEIVNPLKNFTGRIT